MGAPVISRPSLAYNGRCVVLICYKGKLARRCVFQKSAAISSQISGRHMHRSLWLVKIVLSLTLHLILPYSRLQLQIEFAACHEENLTKPKEWGIIRVVNSFCLSLVSRCFVCNCIMLGHIFAFQLFIQCQGVVYMDESVLGWKPLAEAWLASRSSQERHVSIKSITFSSTE